MAFVVEHFNNTLRTSQEVERYLRVPNLGIIPDFVSNARRRSRPPSPWMVLVPRPHLYSSTIRFPYTEAYRMLRTTLLVAQDKPLLKRSCLRAAYTGKARQLQWSDCAVLAQMGVRVLVIDVDLRCSACHTVLGIENKAGLAEVLAGRWDPSDVIRRR